MEESLRNKADYCARCRSTCAQRRKAGPRQRRHYAGRRKGRAARRGRGVQEKMTAQDGEALAQLRGKVARESELAAPSGTKIAQGGGIGASRV